MFIALVGHSSGDAKEQRGFSACAHYMEAAFKELVDEVNYIIHINMS